MIVVVTIKYYTIKLKNHRLTRIFQEKTLYLVHTEHTEAYNKVSKNMVLIEERTKYEL